MVVALLTLELWVAGARSLKDKRRVVKSLVTRLRQRYNLSVGEAGYHDVHNRALVAAAWLGPDGTGAHQVLEGMIALAEATDGAVVVAADIELVR